MFYKKILLLFILSVFSFSSYGNGKCEPEFSKTDTAEVPPQRKTNQAEYVRSFWSRQLSDQQTEQTAQTGAEKPAETALNINLGSEFFDLAVRLERERNIHTIVELIRLNKEDLLNVYGVDPAHVDRLEEVLESQGLSLGMTEAQIATAQANKLSVAKQTAEPAKPTESDKPPAKEKTFAERVIAPTVGALFTGRESTREEAETDKPAKEESRPGIAQRAVEGVLSQAQSVGRTADRVVGLSQAVDQVRASQSETPENAGRTRRALRSVAFAGQVGFNVAGQAVGQATDALGKIRKPKNSDQTTENDFVMNQNEMLIFSRFTGILITSATRREILNTLKQEGLRTYEDLARKTRSELLSIKGIYPLYVDSIEAILKSKNLSLGMTETQIADMKSSAAAKSQTAEESRPSITRRATEGILSKAQSVGRVADRVAGFSQAVDQVRASQSEAPENAGKTRRALRSAAFAGQVGFNVAGQAVGQAADALGKIRKPKNSDQTQPADTSTDAQPAQTQPPRSFELNSVGVVVRSSDPPIRSQQDYKSHQATQQVTPTSPEVAYRQRGFTQFILPAESRYTQSVGDINLDTPISKAYLPHAKKLPEHIATLRDLTQTTESELIESGLNAQQVHQIKISLSHRGYHLAEPAKPTATEQTAQNEGSRPGITQRATEGILSTAQAIGRVADRAVGLSQAVDQVRTNQSETPENAGKTRRALRSAAFAGQVGFNVAGQAVGQAADALGKIRKPKNSDQTPTEQEQVQQPNAETKPATAQTQANTSDREDQYFITYNQFWKAIDQYNQNAPQTELITDQETFDRYHDRLKLPSEQPSIAQRAVEGVLSQVQAVGRVADRAVGLSQAVDQVRASQSEAPENAGKTRRALRSAAFAGQVGFNVAGQAVGKAADALGTIRKPKNSDEAPTEQEQVQQPNAETKPATAQTQANTSDTTETRQADHVRSFWSQTLNNPTAQAE